MIFSNSDLEFASKAYENDRSVVLALQVAFFGKCDDQGLGPRDGHFPVCQILLQIVVRAVITASPLSPPVWTSSAGMLSAPADFPFFRGCTAAYTFFLFFVFAKDGVVVLCVCLGEYTDSKSDCMANYTSQFSAAKVRSRSFVVAAMSVLL